MKYVINVFFFCVMSVVQYIVLAVIVSAVISLASWSLTLFPELCLFWRPTKSAYVAARAILWIISMVAAGAVQSVRAEEPTN